MDIATIRQGLEAAHQEHRALIAGLSDDDLERLTPNPKWRVRQLAAHIALDDAGTVYVGKLLARGKNAKAPDFVVDLANWWGLRKYRRARVADLLPVMDAKHRELMAWLDTLTPEALSRGGEISQMGKMSLGEFLLNIPKHARGHGDDIRTAIAQPGSQALSPQEPWATGTARGAQVLSARRSPGPAPRRRRDSVHGEEGRS